MAKYLCNDFAVIFLCLIALNEQGGGLWIWRLLPEELISSKKQEQTTLSTWAENENLLQFCLPYWFAHAGKYSTPTLILKEQFYKWTNLFSLKNISQVWRCFHSDKGLALLRKIKVAVKLGGMVAQKNKTQQSYS